MGIITQAKQIFILGTTLLISYPIYSQDLLQNTGINAEIFSGDVHVLGTSGKQYGLRLGLWPKSWLSVGLESSTAQNLSENEYMDFTRLHLYTALHLRAFKYLYPYVIGTYGKHKQPNKGFYELEAYKEDVSYVIRTSVTLKVGLALEIWRIRLAIENGGGTMGTGHTEDNISLSYSLKQLPKPTTLPHFTVTSGLHNFAAFTGPYEGEKDFPGFEFTLEFEKEGNIREYNAGIFFTNYKMSTGCFNLGTGWRIKSDNKISDYVHVTPGIQILIWAEPDPDFLLPAISLGLGTEYQLWKLLLFAKSRILATINSEFRFISGATYTFGVGLAF